MKGITLPTLQIAAVAFLVMTCQAAAIGKTNSQVDESSLGPRNPDIGSTIDGAIPVQENALLARSDDVLEKRKKQQSPSQNDAQPQSQPQGQNQGQNQPQGTTNNKNINISPKLGVSVSKVGGDAAKKVGGDAAKKVGEKAGESVAKKVGIEVGETALKGLASFLV